MAEVFSRGVDAIEQAGAVGRAARAPHDRDAARRLVLVSVGLLAAMNVYRANREPGSLYKRMWGTGVLGVMLSVLADFAPEIAGPFALLIALGSFSAGGDRALQALTGRIASTPVGSPPGVTGPVGVTSTSAGAGASAGTTSQRGGRP